MPAHLGLLQECTRSFPWEAIRLRVHSATYAGCGDGHWDAACLVVAVRLGPNIGGSRAAMNSASNVLDGSGLSQTKRRCDQLWPSGGLQDLRHVSRSHRRNLKQTALRRCRACRSRFRQRLRLCGVRACGRLTRAGSGESGDGLSGHLAAGACFGVAGGGGGGVAGGGVPVAPGRTAGGVAAGGSVEPLGVGVGRASVTGRAARLSDRYVKGGT